MSHFKFKKRYGQNFLQDSNIIEHIVRAIEPDTDDLILEIGPGSGALTKKLKNFSCEIVAFEIDEETSKYLSALEDEKTHIIYEDFMIANLEFIKNKEYKDLYIIGNLPYYITTAILEKIMDSVLDPKEIVIMVQKEVADRFLAKPKTKEYGYMTVLLNYHYDIKKVTDVNRKAFKPVPNVDSTVIKLSKKTSPETNYTKFKQLLKDSFQFKRKKIVNNLRNYDTVAINEVLKKHKASQDARAEELDLETFIDITNKIDKGRDS